MHKTATLIAAAAIGAGTLFTGLSASAATTPASDLSAGDAEALCNKLKEQYDFVAQFKGGLPYMKEAKNLHDAGIQKCSGGNPAEGVTDLRNSIRTMYVVPDTL